MRTMASGDFVITENDYAFGVARLNELLRLKEKREVNEAMRAAKHGHVFDYNRTCSCGMSVSQYNDSFYSNQSVAVCRDFISKHYKLGKQKHANNSRANPVLLAGNIRRSIRCAQSQAFSGTACV